ncbi:MAG: oligopeptide/dipeptide ABC transporter ATP-binding protein [Acidimicrobiia bacterium]
MGKTVETGAADQVYEHTGHPPHAGAALGVSRSRPSSRASAPAHRARGRLPQSCRLSSSCRFRTRCWKAQDICAEEGACARRPGPRSPVACHFAEEMQTV